MTDRIRILLMLLALGYSLHTDLMIFLTVGVQGAFVGGTHG